MLSDTSHYLRINEIKNYLYCPRISYYSLCLALDRETGLSQLGIAAEAKTKQKMHRRQHALHKVHNGIRHFDVALMSHSHQLVGRLDEVVETENGLYLVDYKDTDHDFGYWKTQMSAYVLCVEAQFSQPILGSYIYTIPNQQYVPLKINAQDRHRLAAILQSLRDMVEQERCPPPVEQIGKCRVCQYARFCNDVF